ncbi:MAG: precorrin-8X methylmutase [Cyanobacteria bacterium P01_A01_bin.84]
MEWHSTDAQSLASIDREIGSHVFPPAEYEIVRRVVYATADFDYKSLISFSERALEYGAAAISTRQAILVDVTVVKAGIVRNIQKTFINQIYCAYDSITSIDIEQNKKNKTTPALGIEILAKRYPQGIFVIGESQTALNTLVDLIESKIIQPSLVIATPPEFASIESKKQQLQKLAIPHIITTSNKGNSAIAIAIIDALIDLAWQVYGKIS